MDIPRGHAMLPLNESDFLDFIFNYFKAEYAPIRSFWSTATADPRQPQRWVNMGHELQPLTLRAANAQAQKDLDSLTYFTLKWRLDPVFIRGLVIRFAKYELHERLEKKLFECARLDLMIRKALKEKHLIDALWPSPAPRSEPRELLAQGVQVRRWYGDMFAKYFTVLRSVDEFEVRPEVDQRMKSSSALMLVPFVEHLVDGEAKPIVPIAARGAGYVSGSAASGLGRSGSDGYGEAERFEIRFDAPAVVEETFEKSVVRQRQCLKCGTKRDVQVVISVDPSADGAGGSGNASITANTAVLRRLQSSDRHDRRQEAAAAPSWPPQARPQTRDNNAQPPTPEQKKQCPRCTFLNHASLTDCEMCAAPLPSTTVSLPPSPVAPRAKAHAHSASVPAAERLRREEQRPGLANRHSLSSTLFSILPFVQGQGQEGKEVAKGTERGKVLATQQVDAASAAATGREAGSRGRSGEQAGGAEAASTPETQRGVPAKREGGKRKALQHTTTTTTTTHPVPASSSEEGAEADPTAPYVPQGHRPRTPPQPDHPQLELSRAPEMAMMPLTPSPSTPHQRRQVPAGLPSHLMDESYVPSSPGLPLEDEGVEEDGWADLRRRESERSDKGGEEGDREEERGLVDLDAVAREEMGVWGDRDED
ncbi:hypothetical protein B5807_12131 [Epicoccum nigrum]|uniref:RanBP2-type domain-containing protein n=1 Tax=Epicoccum nigrum TaxID=105696 RepID=A0A1Y2LH46_EPING|nr:hypothetical protein B5807_12131 [Epicoccum nigrum]